MMENLTRLKDKGFQSGRVFQVPSIMDLKKKNQSTLPEISKDWKQHKNSKMFRWKGKSQDFE